MILRAASIGLAVLVATSGTLAGPKKISPLVNNLFAYREAFHASPPWVEASEGFEGTGQLPILVRSTERFSQERRAALERAGVLFADDAPLASGAWMAKATREGVRALERDETVERVTADVRVRSPHPLDASNQETRANDARRAQLLKGQALDGSGVVIADIDSGIFVFHPTFFRADAGTYAWTDVNEDGQLTPEVDGVDLDANGTIDAREVLHVLRAQMANAWGRQMNAPSEGFRPERDFLYLDENENGKRDYGKDFSEDTPAYGEPIFVFDDANRDGSFEKKERLLRLGTCKVRAVKTQRGEFVRGGEGARALSQLPSGSNDMESMGHGTGVAGILVGGVPGVSSHLGLAPQADLVLLTTSAGGPVASLKWAAAKGASVVLTEYAPYTTVTLDGSSEEDAFIDASADAFVTVSPAGNLAESHKHLTVSLRPGQNRIPIRTEFEARAKYALISMHHRSPQRATRTSLSLPSGTEVALPVEASPTAPANGLRVMAHSDTTRRGTFEHHVAIEKAAGWESGVYSLNVTLDAGEPLEVDFYLGDDVSSWSGGFVFEGNTRSRTMCSPSTGDKTLSVAAYVLHDEMDFMPAGKAGELARYSSRGPLLHGGPAIEIAAPDNPLSVAPPLAGPATYQPFGGTSGAGPHVAAAVALLRQAFPEEGAPAWRERIMKAARKDSFTAGDREGAFGAGKLDIAGALGLSVSNGEPPRVHIVVPQEIVVGQAATAILDIADEDTPALRMRWDLNYDGDFDTDWLPVAAQAIDTAAPGVRNAKVEVRDAEGYVAADTMLVRIVEGVASPAPPPPSTTPTAASDDGCGCRVTSHRSAGLAAWTFLVFGCAWWLRRRRPFSQTR